MYSDPEISAETIELVKKHFDTIEELYDVNSSLRTGWLTKLYNCLSPSHQGAPKGFRNGQVTHRPLTKPLP